MSSEIKRLFHDKVVVNPRGIKGGIESMGGYGSDEIVDNDGPLTSTRKKDGPIVKRGKVGAHNP